MAGSPLSPSEDQRIVDLMRDPRIALDPYLFVMTAYPWGKPNTPLANFKGPKRWQAEELQAIAKHLHAQQGRMALDLTPDRYQRAVASGRGIGKSALVAWLNHWLMSTCYGATCLVSANSEPQLKGVTFPEIKKWMAMGINAHWFEMEALSIKPQPWFASLLEKSLGINSSYYYVQAKLWTEENPDSYAGPHSHNGMMVTFDEGSGIPKEIWMVARGFFTEPTLKRFHFAFSQPRRNSGGFFDCFSDPEWRTSHIDARDVEGADQAVYESIIRRHGMDGDATRVEVLGQFPRAGEMQFIPANLVVDAQQRTLDADDGAPMVMGVDVGRSQNGDPSVIRWRQGRDARSIPPQIYRGLDNMALADRIAQWIDRTRPDAVCIDAGNGTGVIDRLKQMRYRNIYEVWFGSASTDQQFYNKRTQMYGDLLEWLPGAMLDASPELYSDLTAVEYKLTGKGRDQKALEPKDELKKRLGRSPDDGDALALTFAVKPARRDAFRLRNSPRGRAMIADGVDAPVFG